MSQLIEDYLKYYIGQKCIVDVKRYYSGSTGKTFNLKSVPAIFDSINRSDNQWVGITYECGEWGLEYFDCFDQKCRVYGDFIHSENTKPILRRLSDMTEEELIEFIKKGKRGNNFKIASAKLWNKNYLNYTYDKQEQEKFSVKAIGGGQTMSVYEAEQFHYLLSIGIDLFGLIDAGLAIDAKINMNEQA